MSVISYTALREIENDFADFILLLLDAGSGAVKTDLIRGTGPVTFTRASPATTTLSTGLIANVLAGVPRSLYSPAGVYLGYFAEGLSKNLCLQAENFGTTWAAVGTPTRTPGSFTCGSVVLDLIGDDDGAVLEGYSQTIGFTGNAVKAVSVFIKQGTSTSSVIRLVDTTASANRLVAVITWSSGVPVVTVTTGTDLTGTPVQQGTSGVWRLRFATTSVTAANVNSLVIYPATTSALLTTNTGNISVGGVQAEDKVFATSYIPTTTVTVTRNADAMTFPFAGNANVSFGTWYAEITTEWAAPSQPNAIVIGYSTAASGAIFIMEQANDTSITIRDGTNTVAKTGLLGTNGAVKRKRAVAYSGVTMSAAGDGVAVATGAFDGFVDNTIIGIGCDTTAGGDAFHGTLYNVRGYKSRVTDTQLQTMTDPTKDFVRFQSFTYNLEFNAQQADRSREIRRSVQQPIGGGAPEVLLYRQDQIESIMTNAIAEASIAQWREFVASVAAGESFSFDRYGTVAAPDSPKSMMLWSESIAESRAASTLNYTISIQGKML